ncbi:MAG: hypothetical protein HKO56_00780 [Bacteroidia bacterium]|nr:sulfotransferase [Bacteroidia bacterium]NNC84966.1 hypothetical protein [Bacteroidia bacterium]NNM15160.1 hypothetical protein [Bacteroidia bacterium]
MPRWKVSKVEWKLKTGFFKSISVLKRFIGISITPYIICGSGRSGTTWLAEMFSTGMDSPLINEPLQISDSKKLTRLGFGWNQPPPPEGESWQMGERIFTQILDLRLINLNKFSEKNFAEIKQFIFKNKAVLKFTRLNLLVKWVVNQFDIPKPVYIVRNPYAVVASQLNHPAWSGYKLNLNTNWFQNYFDEYQPQIDEANSKVKLLALEWSIQNKNLLDGRLNEKVHVIYFEDLMQNPRKCLEEIQNVWNIRLHETTYHNLNKPSGSTPGSDQFETDEDKQHHLSKWKNVLTNEEINDISNILKKNNYPAEQILKDNMFRIFG